MSTDPKVLEFLEANPTLTPLEYINKVGGIREAQLDIYDALFARARTWTWDPELDVYRSFLGTEASVSLLWTKEGDTQPEMDSFCLERGRSDLTCPVGIVLATLVREYGQEEILEMVRNLNMPHVEAGLPLEPEVKWADTPLVEIPSSEISLINLMLHPAVNAFKSRQEASLRIRGGAVKLNKQVFLAETQSITPDYCDADGLRVQVGRKFRVRVKLV